MGNPLSDSLGNNTIPSGGNRNIFTIMKEYNNFQRNFRGNPEQTIQGMLNNGQLNQDQLDRSIGIAKFLQRFFR